MIDLVYAERADLSTRSSASVTSHQSNSPPVLKWDFFIRDRRAKRTCIRRLRLGLRLRCRSTTEATFVLSRASRIEELDLIGYDFCHITLRTVLCLVAPDLDAAFHRDAAALDQVITTDLSKLAPCHDRNEIRRRLTVIRISASKTAVNSQCERAYSHTRLRIADLRITSQTSNQYCLEELLQASLTLRRT